MTMGYDPTVLRKLQLAEMEIFKDFIAVCEKNEIEYFLAWGCAIGVERHGGFVPWDDDVDIGMTRANYEKFIEVARNQCQEKYYIMDIDADPKFPFYNANFVRKGTRFIPKAFKHLDLKTGIDVAVYPFDNIPDNKLQWLLQNWRAFFWGKIRLLIDFEAPELGGMAGVSKEIVALCCKAAYHVLRLLHVSRDFVNKKYLKAAIKYNGRETKAMTCFFSRFPSESVIWKTELYPLQDRIFEGIHVKLPQNNHEILTRCYGDYMKLPPEEKRWNHAPEILEFGDLDGIMEGE